MSYTKILSHPPDKELKTHLEKVGNFSKSIFNSLEIESNSYLEDISFLIGISHDFAKSTSFFQKYIRNHQKSKNTYHSFLSAIFTYFVVDNYIKNNNINFDQNIAIIAYIVVLKHHGNLENIIELFHKLENPEKYITNQVNDLKNIDINLNEFYKAHDIDVVYFLENFEDIKEQILLELLNFEDEKNLDNYTLILLLFSILIDADKMAASQTEFPERKNINPKIVDNFKKNNFGSNTDSINKIRDESYNEVISNIYDLNLNDRILTVNLPTGTGKTLTGFSAALKLKDKINKELNFNPRIIYSLPFLSIIDQNENNIKRVLEEENIAGSNYLLKHNYLSDMKYDSHEDNEEYYDIGKSKLLVEGWNSEIIITTFVQFFNSIFSNRNSAIRKFHNITNSIILLDEIQSIPYKYWSVINVFLKKLAMEYNCWVILMTATQPMIFDEYEYKPLINNPEYYFNQFNRVEYNFNLKYKEMDIFKEELLDTIEKNPDKDILVILNTISSSKIIYEYLKEYFSDINNDCYINDDNGIFEIDKNNQLIYLSTEIIPKDRLKRIDYINKSENNKRKIIISTQLIEAGVDIDVDIVYRDLAPLDSIIQCAGRCNRNNKKEMGKVNIISLINENKKLYSGFIYEKLLLDNTRYILRNRNIIQEKDFNFKASKDYFKNIKKRGSQVDVESILAMLKFNDISKEFQLINNDEEKVNVFVCIDDKATSVFNTFLDIKNNYNGYERKNKFLEIKNEFYNYIVSVNPKKIGATRATNKIEDDDLFFIHHDKLDRKYKKDTGFLENKKE